MPPRRILIFGGTGDARELATQLVEDGFDVTTTLAGVTTIPTLLAGKVRRGGFGGAAGIARYVAEENIDLLIDATHPFATNISRHISEAAAPSKITLVRLERAPWLPVAGDHWIEVLSLEEAASAIPPGSRALVTTGRRGLDPFFARTGVSGIVRMIEAPESDFPPGWAVLRARPPYTLEQERRLFDQKKFTVLVTKNAGGPVTATKLIAARERKIPVVMIARPEKPIATTYATPQALVAALKA